MFKKILISYVLVIIIYSFTYADYHYASHTGNNVYPYTSWATAALLIQDAVNAASPHDTVYIGAGVYYESIVVDCDSIAIIGMGWDSTTLWYDVDDTAIVRMAPNRFNTWYVEGIRFENYGDYVSVNGGTRNNLHVNQCWFTGDRTQGPSGIGTAAAPDFVLIENCVFDSLENGFWDILGSKMAEVKNCLFTNFDNKAITFDNHYGIIRNNIIAHGHPYHPPIFGETDTLLAVNNLIYGHGDSYYISGLDTAIIINNTLDHLNNNPNATAIAVGRHKTIINNSISNIARIAYIQENSIARIAYNNFWNIANEFYGNGQIDSTGGNLRVNPMYVGGEDYHLQAYSPLIDAGDPDILDIDGSRSDIGVYGGPLGEQYIYLDLPPSVPDSITGQFDQDSIILNWLFNTEADFSHYLLHRDTVSGFEPTLFNQIAEPDTSYYTDTDITNEHDYYYRIASIDNQDNISEYCDELAVATTAIWDQPGVSLPQITSIKSNYPNPFNSSTTIVYSVADLGPIPAKINIDIYDLLGRKVRSLIDERKEVGTHKTIWDGKNDSGEDCPSGVYFACITQWHSEYLSVKRKLVLVK